MEELTRTCKVCQVEKDIEQFAWMRNTIYRYRRGTCTPCQRIKWSKSRKARQERDPESKARDDARDKKWRKENPEKVKLTYLRHRAKKLGLDPNEVVMYYNSHPLKCEICFISVADHGQELAIDHDHKSGKFRGLICKRCNLTLGAVNDDIGLLERMIGYIKENH